MCLQQRHHVMSGKTKLNIGAYNRMQAPHYSLGGYSHWERWSRTR
jgi:hypothetical protein